MSRITDKSKTVPIVDQKDALGLYFGSLLAEDADDDDDVSLSDALLISEDEACEPTAQRPDSVAVIPEPEAILLKTAVDDTPFSNSILTGTTILVTPQVIEAPVVYEQHNETHQISDISENNTALALLPDSGTNQAPGIPEWGQSYFQCLMFKVAGVKLAAPLERLNGILEWPDHITVLPKHAPWFIGLVRNREQNVQLVDLAEIMNVNLVQRDSMVPLANRAKYIMLIDDGHWGIASDSVSEVITLESSGVRWHDNKYHKWLVGTVVNEMCTLLDVDGLIHRLHAGS